MVRFSVVAVGLALLVLGTPAAGYAQITGRSAVDTTVGYAGFVDEETIRHLVAGLGWRWQATRHLSLGPEIIYMRGPGHDRDLFVTGKLIVNVMPRARAVPYVVADGGLMFHRDVFRTGPFWSREGAVSFGGGVRVNLTPHLSIGPEVRIGWEPHVRVAAVVSWRGLR